MEHIYRFTTQFNSLVAFIEQLMICNDQLFHKYMCYFKSPRRLFNHSTVTNPCTLFTDLLKFREFCLKFEQRSKLNTKEKVEWMNVILKITKNNTKNEAFQFGGMQFSTDNTVICNNKYGVIGFKRETETIYSNESLTQSLYTFPAMMTKVLATDPSKFDYNYKAFIVFNKDGMIITKAEPLKNKDNSIELKQVVRNFVFAPLDMIRALVFLCIHNQLRCTSENICREAIELAEIKQSKSIEEFFNHLLETKKNTTAPKASKKSLSTHQKQVLKERTSSILKDITNIQMLPPNTQNKQTNKASILKDTTNIQKLPGTNVIKQNTIPNIK